jgi:hypothetical protein
MPGKDCMVSERKKKSNRGGTRLEIEIERYSALGREVITHPFRRVGFTLNGTKAAIDNS